jgi:hypothetical protein
MFSLLDELQYIIPATCKYLDIKRKDENDTAMVLHTGAVESALGRDLRQSGFSMKSDKGAFGLYQMELPSADDIWKIVLPAYPKIQMKINQLLMDGITSEKDNLTGNIWYATAMCRMQYYRFSEPLPDANDIYGQANYWMRHYNKGGKGTVEKFVAAVRKYVLK